MITNYFSLHSYFVIQKDEFDWFVLSCLILQNGISYHIFYYHNYKHYGV